MFLSPQLKKYSDLFAQTKHGIKTIEPLKIIWPPYEPKHTTKAPIYK